MIGTRNNKMTKIGYNKSRLQMLEKFVFEHQSQFA